ncbi:hypothetical protein GCM10020358_37510 [Amorphoplanes nipponensis]
MTPADQTRRARTRPSSGEKGQGGMLRNLQVSHKLFASFGVLSLLVIAVGLTGLAQLHGSNGRLETMYERNVQAIDRLGEVRADVQQATSLSAKLILRSPLADVSNVQMAIKRLDSDIDTTWAAYAATPAAGTQNDRGAFTAGLAEYRKIRDQQLVPAATANSLSTYLGVQNNYIDPLTSKITVALNNLAGIEDKAAQRQMAAARSNATHGPHPHPVADHRRGGLRPRHRRGGQPGHRPPAGPDRQGARGARRGPAGPAPAGPGPRRGGPDGRGAQHRPGPAHRGPARHRHQRHHPGHGVRGPHRGGRPDERVRGPLGRPGARRVQRVGGDQHQHRDGRRRRRRDRQLDHRDRPQHLQRGRGGRARGPDLRRGRRHPAQTGRVLGRDRLGHQIITGIAEQTNLLALNATIEAARAGEMGKGFAVVAGEVKELAQETARATEDIRTRVGAIQNDSTAAVAAIAEIGAVIDQINATQTAIAAAVEEQTATTNEMGRNVGEVAAGSTEISSNVAEVAEAAAETTTAASNTAAAADELSRVAHDLKQSLAMFRY